MRNATGIKDNNNNKKVVYVTPILNSDSTKSYFYNYFFIKKNYE